MVVIDYNGLCYRYFAWWTTIIISSAKYLTAIQFVIEDLHHQSEIRRNLKARLNLALFAI